MHWIEAAAKSNISTAIRQHSDDRHVLRRYGGVRIETCDSVQIRKSNPQEVIQPMFRDANVSESFLFEGFGDWRPCD